MKEIKILGTGCAKCNQLTDAVKSVIAAENIEASVEKVEDIQKIMAYRVLSTPALVVDGQVLVSGRVPSASELRNMLSGQPTKGECCCGGGKNSSCC
jgi:small redox-active disulfide protein 2